MNTDKVTNAMRDIPVDEHLPQARFSCRRQVKRARELNIY